jgi:hypothetical protein
MTLALVLQVAGCIPYPEGDPNRENAAIAARIHHRMRLPAAFGWRERMTFTRWRGRSEPVVCVAVTQRQGPAARFIYRSGCLFGESDLSPPVFDRWRRDFCENS